MDRTKHPAHTRTALLRITAVPLIAAAIFAYSALISELKAQSSSPTQSKTISIPVEGMSCVPCAARVKRALKGMERVQHVEVSLERREALVQFSPEKVTAEHLEAAINKLGYRAGKSRVVESK